MSEGLQIADRDFIINLHGFKAVIVYPAMGTPALMKDGDSMTVILAAEETAFLSHKKECGLGPGIPMSSAPGSPLLLGTALKFHAQLTLTHWGVNDYCSGYIRYMNHLVAKARGANTIYGGQDKAVERFKQGDFFGYYMGELKPGKENFITLAHPEVTPYPAGPFGTLHDAAVDMYIKAGYKHLFQITFSTKGSPVAKGGLMELSFLYLEYSAYLERWTTNQFEAAIKNESLPSSGELKQWTEKEPIPVEWYLTNPGDELLSNIFDKNINKDQIIPKYTSRSRRRRSSPAFDQDGQISDGWSSISVPRRDCNAPPEAAGGDILAFEFKFFPLFNPQPVPVKIIRSAPQKSGSISENLNKYRAEEMNKEKKMAYLKRHDGGFLCSRHPVYFSDKDYLDFGVVADTHICGRQTLFKLAAPQVIEGAPPEASPFLGSLTHEAIAPTWRIMENVGKESDALLWLGDLYDFVRDINPAKIANPAFDPTTKVFSASTTINTTGDLWNNFKFNDYRKDYTLYPRFVDAIMSLSIVHNHYQNTHKPLCMVAGNHEGMNTPYGTSPRIRTDITGTLIRMNTSVASDHNLTFYEAALLFGKDFEEAYLLKTWNESRREAVDSFKKENVDWYYQAISPWRDCVVSHGNRQNIIMLGWGNGQDIMETFLLGGSTLPRANKACAPEQYELALATSRRREAANILCSHFSYACFEPNIPLFMHSPQQLSGMTPTIKSTAVAYGKELILGVDPGSFTPPELTENDYGSFYGNRAGMYGLFGTKDGDVKGRIHATICGHTHRCGAYFYTSPSTVIPARPFKYAAVDSLVANTIDNDLGLDSLDLSATNRTVSLVCGSTGLYSHQNLWRGLEDEFRTDDFEPSQGMVVHFSNKKEMQRVDFKRDPLGLPSIPAGGDGQTQGAKPRLAVRLDYLWYEAGDNDGSPFASRGRLPKTAKEVGRVVGGAIGGALGKTVRLNHDISCENDALTGEGFSFRVNPTWLKFFYPKSYRGRVPIPLKSFTLYAVHKQGTAPTLAMEPMPVYDFQFKGDDMYMLGATPKNLEAFLKGTVSDSDRKLENWLFFFSVKLQDIRSNVLGQQYDLDSPWCFPVTVDTKNYRYFDRPFGEKGELPDFKTLQYIAEYKSKV